ncbi:MAG TPA: HEAT repeat domain-containing protein [Candidatus Lokiarchaeia archaeon]|nr:HEAT repeat domain-containing protein [Candidatus Lokiarchaeia archaeon]
MSEDDDQGDFKGLKKYEKMLKNKKKAVKLAAIKEIRELDLNGRRTVRLLEAVLEQTVNPDEWDVKNEAITTIGLFGSKHSIHHLAAHLNDPNPIVRESAAYALGQIKDKKSLIDLFPALDDEAFSVREKAANALAKIGDPRAIDMLAKKTRSKDPQVRLSILPALAVFENESKAIDALVDALHDEEMLVRFPAIIAFNRIKYAKAIDPLIENLNVDDPLLQKVAADALVFNLGWGSIENNQLTKFGERRRQLLLSEGQVLSRGIAARESSSETEEKRFSTILDELCGALNLDEEQKGILKEFLDDLDNYYKIVKK